MEALSSLAVGLIVTAFLGSFVGISIAYVAWQRRETRGAKQFVPYVLSYSGWMLAAGLLWASSSRTTALFFQSLIYVFSILTLVSWALFVVSYTGQRDRFAGWRRTAILGWGVLMLGRTALNPVLGFLENNVQVVEYQGLTLVATNPTIYNVVNLVVVFAILGWTFLLLGQFYQSAVGGQRQQTAVIFVAAVAPAIATIGYNAGDISLYEHLDPTPLFFTVTVVGVWFALLGYDFLDVEPIAAKTLFETMADPVVILDETDTVLDVNESATTLGLAAGDHVETVTPAIAAAIGEDETEVQLETVDSDERVYDLSVSSLTDQQGEPRGRLLVFRDITLRTRREQQLKRQNDRLDEFASVVSHDLRNPLAVADGNLTLIEETGELDRIETVQGSLDRMETIVDDLLTMAKAGETVDSTASVSVGAVARDAWRQVQTTDDETELQVRAEITVQADRSRLLHVFENLFRNAVMHNDPPVTIRVDTVRTEDGTVGGFAIADDGTGIPPADREKIFEHGHTTSQDGTGFGLSIVQDIVAAHGWEIDVTESDDGGARFEITCCVESSDEGIVARRVDAT